MFSRHVGVQGRVQGVAEAVGGEEVQAAGSDEGRGAGHRLQDVQEAVRHEAAGASRAPGGAVGGNAGQIVEVGSFGLVQLEGACEGVEDFGGGSGEVAALHACVVLDADTGEHGDFFATQAGHAPVAAVDRQLGLLRG
jgi:hypothetical protein